MRSRTQPNLPRRHVVCASTRGVREQLKSPEAAKVGSTSRLNAVEVTNPPRMTIAIGPSISLPASADWSAIGKRPESDDERRHEDGPLSLGRTARGSFGAPR